MPKIALISYCGTSPAPQTMFKLSKNHQLGALFHRSTEWFRMEETSRDHLDQPPMLEQGHIELVTSDKILMDFQYLQGWRLAISLDNLSLRLVTLTVKKMFPHVQEEPPMFQFVPITSCSVIGHH